MLNLVLWSILAVWVGIALVMLGMLVVTQIGAIVRTARDRHGVKGSIYCPVHERTLSVVGVPTSFGGAPFDDLRRCEAFDKDPIRCEKSCLRWEGRAAS